MLDLEPPRLIVPDWLRRRTAALVMAGVAAGLSAAALISGSSLSARTPQPDQQSGTRLSRAFRELEQAIQADSRFAKGTGNLGVIRLEQPELAPALALFRTAGSLEPGAPDPLVDLTLPAGTAGQTDQAQETLLRALVASSQGPTHYNLAVLYDRAGETARAGEPNERSIATTGKGNADHGTRMRARQPPIERVLQ